jgi:hypothetical protein
MMRGRAARWGALVGLVGAACTRPNGGFEGATDSRGDGSDAGTTISTGPSPTDGPGSNTLDGPDGSGGGPGSGSDSSGGGGSECQNAEDCQDGEFCNGEEVCAPGRPDADPEGCAPADAPPCGRGNQCIEESETCVECNAGNADLDMDMIPSIACGGDDCDDTNRGIGSPGSDWGHCTECGVPCDSLEACMAGECLPARRVFVTSEAYPGDMADQPTLDGADGRCQEHAEQAELGGTFRAYLRDETESIEAHLFDHALVPYVRLDGVVVAESFEDLTDGSLMFPLSVDELRAEHGGPAERAWTGLNEMTNAHCASWTTLEGNGAGGNVADTDTGWHDNGTPVSCDTPLRLYCIEQG